MSEVVFTQWKVVGPSDFGIRKKSYDNLKMAKVEFGKACKKVEKQGEGKAELFGRYNYSSEWICIQELEYEDYDDEDEDDEENEEDEEDEEDEEPKSKKNKK